jgi:hypothetical protein
MRKFTLAVALIMSTFSMKAQVVATFDTFSLLNNFPDTSYVDYSMPGADIGFVDGGGYFPCVYDTGFGSSYWDGGFVFSNRTDSVTLDYLNDQSAYPAVGYDSSLGYAVAFQGYSLQPYITLADTAADSVLGFYITNTTYAYKTIKYGYSGATKFGDTSGNEPDWFKVTIRGFNNGLQQNDSIDFYLADYRFSNNSNDYIVDDWQWVDLTSLGPVDSLTFYLSSSDTNQFGMLTPGYFAMDDFTTKDAPVSVNTLSRANNAKIYPNPANDVLYVEVNNASISELVVMDVTGNVLKTQAVSSNKEAMNISSLPAGTYLLRLTGGDLNASTRFVKH